MKKKLHPTSQFKKDFKRIQKFPKKIAAFEYIAYLLINDLPIPQEYKPHLLKGEYKGCMECHIEGGFLLIWIDEDRNYIDVIRLGSHSELFE